MPTLITKDNIGEYLVTGEWDIPASMSDDMDAKKSGDSTNFTLRFKLDNEPIEAILASSFKDKRINFQSSNRGKGKVTEGQIVTIAYKGGKMPKPITKEQAFEALDRLAAAAGMTREEFLAAETAKRVPPAPEKLK